MNTWLLACVWLGELHRMEIKHVVGFCNLRTLKNVYNPQLLKIFLHKFPLKEKGVARKL
jgi:hypothetical protein